MSTTSPEHEPLIRRVLGASWIELNLARLVVDEIPGGETTVRVTVVENGANVEVEGRGVGIVDALYTGLLGRYALEYQSLRTVALANFAFGAELSTKRGKSGVDAAGTVNVDVKNSEGKHFTFTDTSRSVTTSTARAILAVVQYFVNSERAFLTLHKARKDALDRGREDLVVRYTAEMAEVVENTSYAEVIDSIRKELKG